MWDTLRKMTLLHFLAIQLTELNPTKTLYWARNGHFWSLILGEGRSRMLVLLVLTLCPFFAQKWPENANFLARKHFLLGSDGQYKPSPPLFADA